MKMVLEKQMLPAKNIPKTDKLLTSLPNPANLPLKSCSRQWGVMVMIILTMTMTMTMTNTHGCKQRV